MSSKNHKTLKKKNHSVAAYNQSIKEIVLMTMNIHTKMKRKKKKFKDQKLFLKLRKNAHIKGNIQRAQAPKPEFSNFISNPLIRSKIPAPPTTINGESDSLNLSLTEEGNPSITEVFTTGVSVI